MREIEFRAWNKEDKIMCYDNEDNSKDYWDGVVSSELGLINTYLCIMQDKYELMQYTGLKDKNGKKIFEGDIIAYTNNQATIYEIGKKMKGFIFYDVECFGGWISKNNFQKHCDWIYADDIKVIGNIYDNPELLGENNG